MHTAKPINSHDINIIVQEAINNMLKEALIKSKIYSGDMSIEDSIELENIQQNICDIVERQLKLNAEMAQIEADNFRNTLRREIELENEAKNIFTLTPDKKSITITISTK